MYSFTTLQCKFRKVNTDSPVWGEGEANGKNLIKISPVLPGRSQSSFGFFFFPTGLKELSKEKTKIGYSEKVKLVVHRGFI